MRNKINLINGNIITLDNMCPVADMISIENGKINGINSLDHTCESLDLKGATVIPGFVDAHFHLTNLGKQNDTLKLGKYNSAAIQEIRETIWILFIKRYISNFSINPIL